jgi:hypothetical protein
MKRRSFFTLLAGAASLLLLLGIGSFAWLFAQSPLSLLRGSPNLNPQAIVFVPQQAAAMASLLVNPDRLTALQLALVKSDQRKAQRQELAAIRDGLLGGGLDYQRDVQPWLGNEVTAAVTSLDLDRDDSNGAQPGYLLALATKDAVRSREFLQLFWQKRAIDQALAFDNYQGSQIISGEIQRNTPNAPPLALSTAVVGKRFVLFANSPKVLRDAINNVQAVDLNLGSSADYQKAIASLPQQRIGFAYLNLPQLATWSGDRPTVLPEDAYRVIAIGLGVDRQGLVAQTAALGGGMAQMAQLSQPSGALRFLPGNALRYLPGNSLLAALGDNLAQTWPALNQSLGSYRLGQRLIEKPITAWAKQLNLDLAQDVFAWVKGNYVMGLLPQAANGEPDWLFILDKQTNPDYDQGLQRLNAVAQQQGLTAGELNIGEQSVMAWTKLASNDSQTKTLEAKAIATWADLGDTILVAPSIDAMKQALAAPKQSLVKAPLFNRSIASVNKSNNGYIYADWTALKPILAKQLPIVQVLDLVGQPLFKHLKSLTISGYGGQADVHRGALLLRF